MLVNKSIRVVSFHFAKMLAAKAFVTFIELNYPMIFGQSKRFVFRDKANIFMQKAQAKIRSMETMGNFLKFRIYITSPIFATTSKLKSFSHGKTFPPNLSHSLAGLADFWSEKVQQNTSSDHYFHRNCCPDFQRRPVQRIEMAQHRPVPGRPLERGERSFAK